MESGDPSFAELVEAARRGDPSASRLLVDRYSPEIRREIKLAFFNERLRRKVSQSSIYQSVMLEFFLELYACRSLESPEHVLRLLKTMVAHKIGGKARYWNSQGRQLSRTVSLDGDEPLGRTSKEQPPDLAVADRDLLAEFERRFTPEEAQILEFRRQELSWVEIAERLGGKPDRYRKSYDRAVDRIKQQMIPDE